MQLGMDTYYMTNKNYEEMRKGIATRVIIPFYEDSEYTVPLRAVLYHNFPRFGCVLTTPFGVQKIIQDLPSRHVSIFSYELSGSLIRQSGLYTYMCRGLEFTYVTGMSDTVILSVSLYLQFIEGMSDNDRRVYAVTDSTSCNTIDPGIFLEGEEEGFEKIFSPYETSGEFIVDIYTIYPITSFEITKDGGHNSEITTTFLSYTEFQIVAKYLVEIPVLDNTLDGIYTISVVNMNEKTKEQKIRLIRAQGKFHYACSSFDILLFLKELDMFVSPIKLEVVEGFIAAFECFIEGIIVGEINWRRDHEPLNFSKVLKGNHCSIITCPFTLPPSPLTHMHVPPCPVYLQN